jgi:predicted patatin/cPLA2 family phospholipase
MEVINMHHCGLILEGGGMRGVFTAGVLDFFMDKKLMFSDVYGVSAGSCHACSYLSGQRKRAFDVNVDYLDDKRYCSLHSLRKTGDLFGVDMLYNQIPNVLNPYDYDTYNRYKGNFYAVLTDCETGQAVYQKVGDMHKDIIYIRASSSLPLLSRIVEVDGRKYLDGGIADSIPVRQSVKSGVAKNIVVLTRPEGYRKSPNRLAPLIRYKYRDYPALGQAVANRHINYNQSLDYIKKEEEKGNVFVIRPDGDIHIGRVEKNREKLTKLYEHGYETAKKLEKELLRFVE